MRITSVKGTQQPSQRSNSVRSSDIVDVPLAVVTETYTQVSSEAAPSALRRPEEWVEG